MPNNNAKQQTVALCAETPMIQRSLSRAIKLSDTEEILQKVVRQINNFKETIKSAG